MSNKTYNGWCNYETWNVNLWLDNEQGSYEEKRDIIRRASSKHKAAQALRDYVEETMPDLGANMWADLLSAAMSEVDWDEIVDAEWDELHEENEDA